LLVYLKWIKCTEETMTDNVPHKVLLVDDENTVTYSISQLFKKKGSNINLVAVNDPLEAIKLLQVEEFNLLITDLMMPGFSGLDLITHVRRTQPDMQVMVITAFGSDQVREEVFKRNVIKYFEKPFELEEFYEKVVDYLQMEDGFSGRMIDMELSDIIQMVALSGNSVLLEVIHGNDVGKIYIRDGIIMHAESNKNKGMDALIELISWQGGDFIPGTYNIEVEPTIVLDWHSALVEATTRKDHAAAFSDKVEQDFDTTSILNSESKSQDLSAKLSRISGIDSVEQITFSNNPALNNVSDHIFNICNLNRFGTLISCKLHSTSGECLLLIPSRSHIYRLKLKPGVNIDEFEKQLINLSHK
jgi:CheY-like chemotaxis protein